METSAADRVLELAKEFEPTVTLDSAVADVFPDSLDFLDFIQRAEKATGGLLDDEELANLQTVEGISNALRTTIQSEKWAECIEEMRTIFPAHWRELARYKQEIAMDVDADRYAALDQAGALVLITARVDGKLIGYFLGFCMPHCHYKSSGLWGMTDMYFILPEYRNGAGVRLFVGFERELRRRGCVQAVTSCKLHEDHTDFLQKLGWTWTDKTFQKHLGGAR